MTAGPPTTIQIGSQRPEFLSDDFLRKRHLCHKWVPHGAAPRTGSSILASPAMEPSDFHSVPRAGKSIDFVYRVSLFECPMVELSGKKFTVHDSSARGAHRADASAMELSDASLSAALLITGRDWESFSPGSIEGENSLNDEVATTTPLPGIEMGPDGYPIVWIKLYQKQGEVFTSEIKPYRASFVRAALWLASTRVEAQREVSWSECVTWTMVNANSLSCLSCDSAFLGAYAQGQRGMQRGPELTPSCYLLNDFSSSRTAPNENSN